MYLGLDLGTSGLKAVLVNSSGEIIESHTAPLKVSRPHSGWSEQNPHDWIDAAREVLTKLSKGAGLENVRGIGLSGQMHGATCIDKDGDVIRPSILWNDTRAQAEAKELDENPISRQITGNITFAGFTSPKILWMKKHEPENYERIAKVLLPKDYLRYWLTGEFVSEMSDASGTAWLDVGARYWSDELLALVGLTQDHMPSLVEGSANSGDLLASLKNEFGFQGDVVVAGGAGDNAATAIGLDIIKSGGAFVSLGTSGVVFSADKAFLPNPESALHAFCHAVPKTWHQMGVTLSATDSLNWIAGILNDKPKNLVDALGELENVGPELFLPFLGGERTPYNSSTLRASFECLGHETTRNALVQAVLEGVCFSLKECVVLMEQSGVENTNFLAVGGGANSDFWLELLATILNRPIARPSGSEHAAAIGAARLGALALDEDIELVSQAEIFHPNAKFVDAYNKKFEKYLSYCPKK